MLDKKLALLSIIRKANKLLLSKDILYSFKKGIIYYVFIASDASEKTKLRYIRKCEYYHVPYDTDHTSEDISRAIGKLNVMTIGITDKGFADTLIKKGGEENG